MTSTYSSIDKEIPVFFSTDDNYIPFLDVAIASLIDNASKEYRYRLIVLNTGLEQANIDKIMQNRAEGFAIEFVDISAEVESIKARFKNVYHFSVVTYYRLFIASLFPQYDKIVYLDCDLVVLGDVSELYRTDLDGCIFGACPEQFVQNTPEFRLYADKAVGIPADDYVNAGVLVIDLEQFRKHEIERKFVELITQYDFDLLDPDQAYLNYLCHGRIKVLPNGWNKEPMPLPCEGSMNIIHFALYKKPWQYDSIPGDEHFWRYAGKSPFYREILRRKDEFSDEDRAAKEATATEILEHARRIVDSDYTFTSKLTKN